MVRCQEKFPLLANLFHIVATLPVSTAECKCGFSILNRMKTKLRSALTPESLDNLMIVSLLGEDMRDFDCTNAVNAWQEHTKAFRHLNRGHGPGSGRKRKKSNNPSSGSNSDSD